uniref:Uncharacterized protein n=1 Tax=Arundo donax TaxID=35708 RepID=A0A0A9HBV6_ARUDO
MSVFIHELLSIIIFVSLGAPVMFSCSLLSARN